MTLQNRLYLLFRIYKVYILTKISKVTVTSAIITPLTHSKTTNNTEEALEAVN